MHECCYWTCRGIEGAECSIAAEAKRTALSGVMASV